MPVRDADPLETIANVANIYVCQVVCGCCLKVGQLHCQCGDQACMNLAIAHCVVVGRITFDLNHFNPDSVL